MKRKKGKEGRKRREERRYKMCLQKHAPVAQFSNWAPSPKTFCPFSSAHESTVRVSVLMKQSALNSTSS